MASVKFWDLDDRLIATIGDGAAVWQAGGKKWEISSALLARKAFAEGLPMTAAKAKADFGADIENVPVAELEQADAEAQKEQTDTDESVLDEIEAELDK